MNNNFERLQILFFGSGASRAEIFSIYGDRTERTDINLKMAPESADEVKIIGLEIMSRKLIKQKLADILNKHVEGHVSDYYFFTKDQKHIRYIRKLIQDLSLGADELFGIDPDYYYSFVPLDGKNRRLIETYILNMKNNYSIKGRIKNFIKRIFININCSGNLYEGFVVTVPGNTVRLN
jgi:hypothetical protein